MNERGHQTNPHRRRWEEIVMLEGTLIVESLRVGTTLADLNLTVRTSSSTGPSDRCRCRAQRLGVTSRTRRAVSLGVRPTRTPTFSSASFFACAVPDDPDTIAPAWPIVFPSGAVNPAT